MNAGTHSQEQGPCKRLFVALPLPNFVRAALAELQVHRPGYHWIMPDNLHLTMRFIGDVYPQAQLYLEEALARVHVHRFILPCEHLGVFPMKGVPRVLWAGVGHGHPCLYQLRQRIDDALLSVLPSLQLGRFTAHITLARLDEQPTGLATLLRTHRDWYGPPFTVDRFVLFSSELGGHGPPRYGEERSFALEGETAVQGHAHAPAPEHAPLQVHTPRGPHRG